MLAKLTELGVHSFRPLVCERSVATVRDERRTLERWQTICIGAARQSGQSYIPVLHGPAAPDALLGTQVNGMRIIAQGGTPDVPSIAKVAAARPKEPICLWIGPEGGWSDSELAGAVAAGVCPARLGHSTLRIETAAIALVAAVIACRDDRPLGVYDHG
jgi:16S rRNA (uracil1498-N3)-methyltransferase